MARGATFTVYRTWVDGNTLTASDLNSALAQYITNGDASGIGSYFISLAEMRTIADPVLGVPANLLVWMHYMHYKLIEIGRARGITLTNWDDDIPGIYALSVGTNTITATFNPALTSHTTGMPLLIKAGGTNTGATTFNPNEIGAKNVLVGATALSAGQIIINKGYWLMYDGTQYQLLNPEVIAVDTITNKTSDYTLVATDLTGRKIFTNYEAAGQVNFIFPTATVNYRTALKVIATQYVNFVPEVTDSVFIGGTTLSPYTAGTISVSNGSAVVTGIGTTWTTNAKAGDSFRGNGGGLYIILSVDSNTQITLTANHSGALSGVTYGIGKSVACQVVGFEFIIESYAANKWTVRGVGVQPGFRARMTDQIPADGVDTLMAFETVEEDTNGNDYNESVGNYKYTVPISGRYRVKLFASLYHTTGDVGRLKLFKNGASIRNTYASPATAIYPHSICNDILFDAGDYIQAYVFLGGASRSVVSSGLNLYFEAFRIPE